MNDNQPVAVPLVELLRGIPKDARLQWQETEGLKAHCFAPVGRYTHEAADEIARLNKRFEEHLAAWIANSKAKEERINQLEGTIRDLLDTAHQPSFPAAMREARKILSNKLQAGS